MSIEQLRLLLTEASQNEAFRQRLVEAHGEATEGYELSLQEQEALAVLTSRGPDFREVLLDLFAENGQGSNTAAARRRRGGRAAVSTAAAEAGELRRLLSLAAAIEIIALPQSRIELLRRILEAAGAVLGARAGSLFLLDDPGDELLLEVAIGPEAEEVQGLRVGIGQGMVGWSAATGQALAVAEVAQDARFHADIGRAIGYLPECILCIPLIVGERVIGVLELLDRLDGSSFTQADIDLGSLFANEAAIAIELAETAGNHARLLGTMVQALGVDAGRGALLGERLNERLREIRAAEPYREAVALATLVAQISERSPSAALLCRQILEAVSSSLTPGQALR